MEENFAYNLKMEDYAQLCHMSLSILKVFNQYYHTTRHHGLKMETWSWSSQGALHHILISIVNFSLSDLKDTSSTFIRVFKTKISSHSTVILAKALQKTAPWKPKPQVSRFIGLLAYNNIPHNSNLLHNQQLKVIEMKMQKIKEPLERCFKGYHIVSFYLLSGYNDLEARYLTIMIESVLITQDTTYKGTEEIKGFFKPVLWTIFQSLKVKFEMDKVADS